MLTVPGPLDADGNGYVTVTSTAALIIIFGLSSGSMDTYNTLTFYLNGVETGESFTGSDVKRMGVSLMEHKPGAVTNHYVNFYDLKTFNSLK